jgi:hypothetical protein
VPGTAWVRRMSCCQCHTTHCTTIGECVSFAPRGVGPWVARCCNAEAVEYRKGMIVPHLRPKHSCPIQPSTFQLTRKHCATAAWYIHSQQCADAGLLHSPLTPAPLPARCVCVPHPHRRAALLRPTDPRMWCALGHCYEAEGLALPGVKKRVCKLWHMTPACWVDTNSWGLRLLQTLWLQTLCWLPRVSSQCAFCMCAGLALRCYRRAVAHGDREGIGIAKLVRVCASLCLG